MQTISPTASLRSSDSSVSSCSDVSVDASFYDRRHVEDGSSDSSQEDSSSAVKGRPDDSNLPVNLNGFHQAGSTVKHDTGEAGNVDSLGHCRNIETRQTGEVQEGIDNNAERLNSSVDDVSESSPLNDEVDAEFWLPPEPEDQEDDLVGSITNYDDDDDECGDGVAWTKPSSFSSFGEEGSGSYKFKEEKLKAMNDVKNGKFRALVSQLLKSVGVDSSGNCGENWVDIVTSLSWDAAAFVKPDAYEGKAMDPDGYVKVKCVATGLRTQSQLIKGLVFKKHAAHKHMPTKYKNPRLLLIQGSLDLSSGGFSLSESMQQEKDNLKSIVEMIDMYQPNVILVEKSVSRSIQESILAKGITLVFDMKLHRLERVARCIGTPILASDVAIGQKLRQCDSFRIEKFVEEHAVSTEGGKKQSKTLMFLEGAPTRLGCTILLMGANSDELKRIKCVVRCAVVMAYHLMLETSFLLDQTAMFSTISPSEVVDLALTDDQQTLVGTEEAIVSGPKQCGAETDSSCTLDIPISNGFHKFESQNLIVPEEGNSSLSFEACNPATFPGLSISTSIQKVMNDSFPLFGASSQSMPTPLGFSGKNQAGQAESNIQISCVPEPVDDSGDKPKIGYEEEKLPNSEQPNLPEYSEMRNHSDGADDQLQRKDEINSVLDSESILVLMSSRNASRGTICDHNHFSHIKFYRSFDVPLGKFLQDNLLNQRLQCKTCSEPPEAHFFYYAHHNKQLTIQVRRLPASKSLPGETEGKLWMWSRCGRCKLYDGSSKSTKRILISSAARGFSFGKFLELSFSNHSSFSSPSSCGHSFHKDFLYFFGYAKEMQLREMLPDGKISGWFVVASFFIFGKKKLGPMVAMFKYSPVITYSVSLPPQKMEFNSSVRGELLKKDSENVYLKGISMFLEIENVLKDLGNRYIGVTLNIQGSSKEFSDIMDMLKQEKSQFEVEMQNAVKNGSEDDAVCKLLSLNRVRLDLLLESCIWDHRLRALLSSDLKVINSDSVDLHAQEQHLLKENGTAGQPLVDGDIAVEKCDSALETSGPENKLDPCADSDFPFKEIPIYGHVEGSRQDNSEDAPTIKDDVVKPTNGILNENGSAFHDFMVKPTSEDHFDAVKGNFQQENLDSIMEHQRDKTISVDTDVDGAISDSNHSLRCKHHIPVFSDLENDKVWIWAPFTDIRREYMEDLQRGCLPKFESCGSYSAESTAQKLISDEGSRLHIPIGLRDYIVSDYEDEFSSIIACALTLLKDAAMLSEDLAEYTHRERGLDAKSTESSESLPRVFSLTEPHWSSFGSFHSDSILSAPTNSLEDLHSSSFDGLDLLESLVSYGASHPEVSMGSGKYPGTRKYSVVCVYANEFRQLRDRCCPSEVDYIASLSRCRNWDAKGGKSKSFFAKTLDDRFIIKEIKRTEFDSFMKFATNYFEYMNQCYDLGNQTCLAKILGIYQVSLSLSMFPALAEVVIRARRNGKEARHDLLVMENLSFGHHIARQYDLKGALHARFNTAGNGSGDVLLDQNFVNDMNASPLYVSRKSKRNLQRAVYNDTNFLNSINVMDYSLLVGVDTQRRELVCGIIDYLRQYTWDKQLENWVKSSLVVPKNQLPTIISPKEYKKRFRKFIDTHFLSVPDHWCSQRSSNPCKLCGPVDGSALLQTKTVKKGNPDDDSSRATSPVQGKDRAGGSSKSPHHGEENGFFA
ncbi:UNVERIFIED_CONTAM: putative 1-phosphatidylinositol-3-phosphate 5-kinase FAB1D [Sesamum indicum]